MSDIAEVTDPVDGDLCLYGGVADDREEELVYPELGPFLDYNCWHVEVAQCHNKLDTDSN